MFFLHFVGITGGLFQNQNFEVHPEEVTVTFDDVKGVSIGRNVDKYHYKVMPLKKGGLLALMAQ